MGIAKRLLTAFLTLVTSGVTLLPASAAAEFSTTGQYAHVLQSFNPNLSQLQSRSLAGHVRTEAAYYRLDARLLVAIESSWHPYVTSRVGAGGLGQLMPGTAAGLGVNAYQPFANLNGTAHYLRGLLDRFGGYDQQTRYEYALAGYNAGPGAVERFGGIPPYTETQSYVRNVMGVWRRLSVSLSSHIDDLTAGGPASVQARSLLHPVRVAARAKVQHKTKSGPVILSAAPWAAAPAEKPSYAASPPPKKKPFLYYLFHRHHNEAVVQNGSDVALNSSAIDAAPTPTVHTGAALALSLPASVSGGRPIHVNIKTSSSKPVTLVAFIGPTVVGQASVPAHTREAVLRGVPGADASRIVVVYAYAQGYAQGHAAVTIVPNATPQLR